MTKACSHTSFADGSAMLVAVDVKTEPRRLNDPKVVEAVPPGQTVDRWGDMMLAAQAGDDVIYDQLLRELRTWLQRYYRRRLSPAAAEDVTQEALMAVHSRRYTYEAGSFGPWLAAIARYKWMDRLRQQYRDHEMLGDDEGSVPDHGASTRSRILLDRLIGRLRPAQASAIRLVKIQGASIEEAAAATGQSNSLVKVNIHRGLKRIAAIIEEGEGQIA